MSDGIKRQNPTTGAWEDAEPMGWQGRIDFEVAGDGPWSWTCWRGNELLEQGLARTRVGLAIALWFARWRFRNVAPPRD